MFAINTRSDISKLFYVISRAVRRVKFETILKYHVQIMLLFALIIYMKKFLDCDWLREIQFFGNTVQKKGN